MSFDPDLKECMLLIKLSKKAATMKEEAAEIFKEGKFDEAIERFEECLKLDDMNAAYNSTLLLNIAICHAKLDKKEEAIRALTRAVSYNPKYAKAFVKRGEMYCDIGEFNEAIRDFSTASEFDSNGFGVQAKMKDAQERAKKAKRKDYYKLLGVTKDDGDAVIKKAYKKAALKWHPDKNTETEEKRAKAEKMFKDVNEAFGVLSDTKKRSQYDQGFDIEDINSGKADMGGFGGMGGGGGIDPNDLFSMFMGSGGMGGCRGGGGRGRGGGGMPPGFGGMGGGGQQQGFTFRFG